MPGKPSARPPTLIDALDAHARISFSGSAWRAVRKGYDVVRATRPGGRWDDGTFDVLYTSLSKAGAVAERIFHLAKGQPVIPSKPRYLVYELEITLSAVLDLSRGDILRQLGVNTEKFGQLSYLERAQEYPSTQQIAEIAHFLEFDGIIVPSARAEANNLVVFGERVKPEQITRIGPGELIDIQKSNVDRN